MSGIILHSLYFLEYICNKIYNYIYPKIDIIDNNNEIIYNYSHHTVYKNIYCDKLIDEKNNIINDKLIHKTNFKNCLRDINNKNSRIYWIYENNIRDLLQYKVVVIDFQCIYDYNNRKELKMDYLNNLSKYLLDNKIIFCIISEINPKYFPELENFNKNNLITPYHYKTKSFGGVVRLGISKYNDKSVKVGVNRIINDIMNQYGCDDKEIVYINSIKIDNINIILI